MVLFHLDVPGLPGGFVGVDVFFVISGFLITSIIRREIDAGAFTLSRFYERRIRRILPALFVVIAVSLAVATALFMPRELTDMAQSGVAATLFGSNVLFFLESGYFDTAVYSKPLLHTWTLAIEEQFYLVVPLLLPALVRWARRPAAWIGALTLASFALCALTTPAMPDAAYYLTPWRAWELGIGTLLAFGTPPVLGRRGVREAAGALGLALVLGSVLLLGDPVPFPGIAALAPTLGAALLIASGCHGPTQVSRLLGTAPPVWIGRLSYSLYLWHWPVIVFYVYWAMDMPGPGQGAALGALSLGLAWLSWRFVEQPFRESRPNAWRAPVPGRLFLGAGVGAGVLCAAAAAILMGEGFPGRLPMEARTAAAFAADYPPRVEECFRDKHEDATWNTPCIYGERADGPAVRVALWGDSHGAALIPALDAAGRDAGAKVALYAHNGCPGIDDFQVYWTGQTHDCGPFLDVTHRRILEDPDLELVILAKRAPLYTQGWPTYGFGERDRGEFRIGTRDGPLPADADRTAFFVEGLERTILALQAAGKRVALVYPLPEVGAQVPEKLARHTLRGGRAEDLVVPRTRFDARAGDVIAAYDRLVEEHDVIALRLHELLCDETVCRLTVGGMPIYRDTNHFSATAARFLAPLFAPLVMPFGGQS